MSSYSLFPDYLSRSAKPRNRDRYLCSIEFDGTCCTRARERARERERGEGLPRRKFQSLNPICRPFYSDRRAEGFDSFSSIARLNRAIVSSNNRFDRLRSFPDTVEIIYTLSSVIHAYERKYIYFYAFLFSSKRRKGRSIKANQSIKERKVHREFNDRLEGMSART